MVLRDDLANDEPECVDSLSIDIQISGLEDLCKSDARPLRYRIGRRHPIASTASRKSSGCKCA